MFGIGMPELLVILVIILIIFGAGRLPEIGAGIGRGIKNFKKATKEPDHIDVTPKEIDPVQNFRTVMSMTRKLEEITTRIDEESMEKLLKQRNPALTVSYLYSLI